MEKLCSLHVVYSHLDSCEASFFCRLYVEAYQGEVWLIVDAHVLQLKWRAASGCRDVTLPPHQFHSE